MAFHRLDRNQLRFKKLSERKNRVNIERDAVKPGDSYTGLSSDALDLIEETSGRILSARENGKAVILAFGAHMIKNGLAPVLNAFIENGWVTHLATNGAGIIHDWEFAYIGESSEDVRENVAAGQFGLWQETGFYINLAIITGAYEGLGYGESVGRMISREGLDIPDVKFLKDIIEQNVGENPCLAASAADLLSFLSQSGLKPGFLSIPHPYRKYSVQAFAWEHSVPFTGHPMIGHDIIYCHPACSGAAIGRTADRDFLSFAGSVSNIDGGVYLSVGSAVMSPMIFEKSLSMAQNLIIQQGKKINDHLMLVVDLAESSHDWAKDGEPGPENPAYYLRFCKTFSRMGGEMHYLSAGNRDFMLALYNGLNKLI